MNCQSYDDLIGIRIIDDAINNDENGAAAQVSPFRESAFERKITTEMLKQVVHKHDISGCVMIFDIG